MKGEHMPYARKVITAVEIDCVNPNCNDDCCYEDQQHFNLVYVKDDEVKEYNCDNCGAVLPIDDELVNQLKDIQKGNQ
jgi:hypothetical protein